MLHKMNLVNFAFVSIKNGIKDIEIRLNDEKRQLIKIGDTIEFTNIDTKEKLRVKVLNLYRSDTFKDLFSSYDNTRFGLNKNDTYDIMYNFYTKEEEKKYGALGIEIMVI